MISFFYNFLYIPIYNILVALIDFIPSHDVGFAVIAATLLVKVVLYPVSKKAAVTQLVIKQLEPEVEKLRTTYKNDSQEMARRLMALYKDKKVNPFFVFVGLLIQIPFIIVLYFIIFKGGLPIIQTDILYSFVSVPSLVNMSFLGLVDMSAKSWVLALLAGGTQFLQAYFIAPPTVSAGSSLRNDLMKSMHFQTRYVLPVVIVFIAHSLTAAVALYWTTSNIFAIAQEMLIRRNLTKKEEV